MTTDVPSSTSPADAVLANVIAQIEPWTRFDRDSLAGVVATTEKVLVHAQQRFKVSFSIKTRDGYGGLPSQVDDVGNNSSLQAHMERQVANARSVLSSRLRQWSAIYNNRPSPRLTAADCFDAPHHVGFAWTCGTCNGKAKVICGTCHGERQVTCNTCGGSGHNACRKCGGNGQELVQRTRTAYKSYTPTSGAWVNEYYQEWERCSWCGGRGTQGCQTCGSRGWVECGTCNATGRVPCTFCGATGTRHKEALIGCDIAQTFAVQAETAIEEARRELESLDIYALCALGPFVRIPGDIDDNTLEHSFTGEVSVTRLGFNMAGARHEIVGYCALGQVKDYKNIIGVLLQEDLNDLEVQLAATSTFPLRPMHMLEAALQKFMSSEINMRIGTLADQPETRLESAVRDEFKQSVSIDYTVDAAAAIRQGLVRIYRSFALPGAAVTAALPGTLIGTTYILGLMRMYPWWSLLGSIGIAFGVGWLLERRARLYIKTSFDNSVGGRAFEIAATHKSVRILRWASGVLGVLGALYMWFKI